MSGQKRMWHSLPEFTTSDAPGKLEEPALLFYMQFIILSNAAHTQFSLGNVCLLCCASVHSTPQFWQANENETLLSNKHAVVPQWLWVGPQHDRKSPAEKKNRVIIFPS